MDLSRPSSPPASRLWDYRISKHLDEHVHVVHEGAMKVMGSENVVDVAVIHHPHHDVLEIVISDPTYHVEVPRMYLRAKEILNGMPKDEFEKQFEEKKDFFRKRHRHYDSHTIERNIRYQYVHNFLQARIHMIYETDFAIDNDTKQGTKIMVFLQAVNVEETVVEVIFDTADILPGQMTSGRRLRALCPKPDLLIPINTKFGEEEHSFVLFQYFERVRVIQQKVVSAFLDNINARIRRYQSEQLALKALMDSQITEEQQSDTEKKENDVAETAEATNGAVANKAPSCGPSPSATPINISSRNDSNNDDQNAVIVVYTGPYTKARCRWIYAIHHTIFRNMVAKARARLDIVSMSRKSPDKILLMDAKRKEAEEVYAALQKEANAQAEAAANASGRKQHRTVMDGIKEAMGSLSHLLTHQYTFNSVSPHSPKHSVYTANSPKNAVTSNSPKHSQHGSNVSSPSHHGNSDRAAVGMLSRGNSMPLPQSRHHSRPTSPLPSSLPDWNSNIAPVKPVHHDAVDSETGKENHNLEALLHGAEPVHLPAVISIGKLDRQNSSPLPAIQHNAASTATSPRMTGKEQLKSPSWSPHQGKNKLAALSPRSSRPSSASANTFDATSNNAAASSNTTTMSSRAQAAMMETKQKLGQLQFFRSGKDDALPNKPVHGQNKSNNNAGSSSTPALPSILTKQKSSQRMRLEEESNRSISVGVKSSENVKSL